MNVLVAGSAPIRERWRRIAYRRVPGFKYLSHPRAAGIVVREILRPSRASRLDNETHMRAAVDWLCRAQDRSASRDGGVSRSYNLIWDPNRGRRGWMSSYPETTGYIIPTMFACHAAFRDSELHRRAVTMADWTCRIQMDNGAVQGGTIDDPPVPATFNTGQVIFGWVHAFRRTGEARYLGS